MRNSASTGVLCDIPEHPPCSRGTEKPGELSTENLTVDLSPTGDMVKLTSTLEDRYIWVDVICMVQDDRKYSHEQLQLMGVICASAKLTMVASDGDAADGRVGLTGISLTRDLSLARYNTSF